MNGRKITMEDMQDVDSPIREVGGSSYRLWRAKRVSKRAIKMRRISLFVYNFVRLINQGIYNFVRFINQGIYRFCRNWADKLDVRSERYKKEGSKVVISNPSCKFINHCTLMLNFTVDNVDKYQIIHQGRFTESYKEYKKKEKLVLEADEDFDEMPLDNKEMFIIIGQKWASKYKTNDL